MDEILLKSHVSKVKRADAVSFKALFDHFQQPIFNFLLYKLNDTATAEDLLQQVFMKLWENRRNLDENQSIKSYIYNIANNLALNHIRHEKVVLRFTKETNQDRFDNQSPQHELEFEETQQILIRAIDRLPDKVRTVFLMSRHDQLSYKEIAARLNISIKTVESHIVSALKQIRLAFPEKFPKK